MWCGTLTQGHLDYVAEANLKALLPLRCLESIGLALVALLDRPRFWCH